MQRLCCTPLPPIGLFLWFLIFFPKEDCNNIKAFMPWEELHLKRSSNNDFIITLQKTEVKYIDKTGNNSFTPSCLCKNPWIMKRVAVYLTSLLLLSHEAAPCQPLPMTRHFRKWQCHDIAMVTLASALQIPQDQVTE